MLDDVLGMRLADPEPGWQDGSMVGPFVDPWIASVVARSRLAEDVVADAVRDGVGQYVILGAGLDTFALRREDLTPDLDLYEVDVSATQDWKVGRIRELGWEPPPTCRFVGVDFESGESWLDRLLETGFDPSAAAVVASLGVTQYLTTEATSQNMRRAASLAPGSRYICTFIIDPDLLEEPDRTLVNTTRERARANAYPWLSVFSPASFVELLRSAGFGDIGIHTAQDLGDQYFAARADGLRPCLGESIAVATVSA